MKLNFTLNNTPKTWDVATNESLLDALRRHGVFGVKHGCETGECGACTVLLDGVPVTSCTMLAAQADGHTVDTVEGLGEHPEQGWKHTDGLHPLQQAFIEAGAIQCGYCTPAQLLAADALLKQNPDPTETEVREALSGVLCRCSGYVRPVEAVLRAAARLRGEEPPPVIGRLDPPVNLMELPQPPPEAVEPPETPGPGPDTQVKVDLPKLVLAPAAETRHVGVSEPKIDAVKLAQGKPAFVADVEMRGMLIGKILHSPIAHGTIKHIDVSKARALPGVHAVLTYLDVPRVVFSTAGQSHPIPSPLDFVSLDRKMRYVGDRVAAVAAETEEIAQRALSLIEVEFEELPAVLDPRDSMKPGAPIIHDEPDYVPFAECDPKRNLATHIHMELGNVDEALKTADYVFEGEYEVPRVQQTPIEPFVCISYWDEDDRMVFRTSTQVPFHARRILAPVLGPAHQTHPRDQAARRRRLRQQARGDDRGHLRAPDHRHQAAGQARVHARGAVHVQHLAPSDDRQDAHRRDERRSDGRQRDARPVGHGRVRQPCAHGQRQHRPQGDVALPGQQGRGRPIAHPLRVRGGLHQQTDLRRLSRLRCAPGPLPCRMPHGTHRA